MYLYGILYGYAMPEPSFEWDDANDREKHGVGFVEAQDAFFDPH
jgi:hypothetical protein